MLQKPLFFRSFVAPKVPANRFSSFFPCFSDSRFQMTDLGFQIPDFIFQVVAYSGWFTSWQLFSFLLSTFVLLLSLVSDFDMATSMCAYLKWEMKANEWNWLYVNSARSEDRAVLRRSSALGSIILLYHIVVLYSAVGKSRKACFPKLLQGF